MEALRLKVHVRADGTIAWPDVSPKLPAGEAEVILLYSASADTHVSLDDERPMKPTEATMATDWPRLDGGRWKERTLRREDLYGDTGR